MAAPQVLRLRTRPLRIALVGQPNVGKSVVFGCLTGRYATVSNYPGTTVAVTSGRALVGAEVCDVIDTPGVNALDGTLSEDERITRDVLTGGGADVVVQVADARNIRRALMLTSQIAAFGKPHVLVLNMIDEAFARGIAVDARALSAALGVPVVESVAIEGRGMRELRDALPEARVPQLPRHRTAGERALWAHELTGRVRQVSAISLASIQETLARLTRRPATGLPILALTLYAMYLFVGVFGAQTLVKLMEDGLFGRGINPAAVWVADHTIPVGWIRDFLVGPYGLITMGATYSIAIVLPVVATFFFVFGFLEDSGYIPRLAIFCDRIFRVMGLNGKAVLPMVLGLGCDTMATMTTRILGTPKERLIAILLLALGVPCSAQLATTMGILGGISFAALATLFAVVVDADVRRRLARGAPRSRRAVGVHHGAPADPLAESRQPADQDAPARVVVSGRSRSAVPRWNGAALRARRIGALDRIASAGQPLVTGLLGLPADDGAGPADGVPAPRLRSRRAVSDGACGPALGRPVRGRADRHDALRAVRRELPDDGARARAEYRGGHPRRHHAGRVY